MKRFLRSKLVLTPAALLIIASAMVIPLLGSILHQHAAHADSSGWTIVPSPNPNNPVVNNSLGSVSATSASDAWAVGGSQVNQDIQQMIMHWDGSQWLLNNFSDNVDQVSDLFGVTAISPSDVWAVGYGGTTSNPYIYGSHPLVEHYLNGVWSIINTPTLNGSLWGVAAVSSSDVWAVGYDVDTNNELIENWNGSSWSVIPPPARTTAGALLHSVAVVSATNIWAVGTNNWYGRNGQAIADYWDGTSWTAKDPPVLADGNGTVLYSASAIPSTGVVWAAGRTYINGSSVDPQIIGYFANGNWNAVTDPVSQGYAYNTITANAGEVDIITYQFTSERYISGNWQTVSVEVPTNGGYLWSMTSVPGDNSFWAVGVAWGGFTLIEQYSPPITSQPKGTWITPSDGFSVQAGTTLHLSANAYPAQANSSIQHVDFAANWNGSWQTICTTTSTSNTFGCYWNLTDTNGTPIPNGSAQVEFTIYDSSGTSYVSSVLQGTITPPQVQQQDASNWAGYVITGKQYTDAKGSWVQPAISCGTKETSYAYFWVGLDGSTSTEKTLEQIGTAAICKNGKASYFVWYEMVPDKPVVIFTGIQSGDQAQAEVSYQGNDKFKLSITLIDGVKTWTNPLTILKRKGAARNSAEWIAEAPCQSAIFSICTSSPWPKFGAVTFTSCSSGGISIASGPTVNEDIMTYGLFHSVKGQPSGLNANNTGFSVQWIHA